MNWRPMYDAPRDGTPVLVVLSPKQVARRDGAHGVMQVAANRGRGWVSIPGLQACTPIYWMRLPAPPST